MLIATNKIDVCGNMTGNTPNPLLDEILSALETVALIAIWRNV
jgi:hypothetical protein